MGEVERFEPSGPLRGTIVPPADKSISHRAALLAAMAEGKSRITGYLDSGDTRSTLRAVATLGARVEEVEGERGLDLAIDGVGLRGARSGARIDVGNAGTLIRLLSGWLAGQEGASFELDGDESIRRRPMARVAEPLRRMGAAVETADGGTAPLRIHGARLSAIDHRLQVASAQVKSAILLAALLAEGRTSVTEPAPTRDHTERMLRAAGATVEAEGRSALPGESQARKITVEPVGRLQATEMTIPGDLSSAAFHIAAALIVKGSKVRVEGVGLNPTRVGLLGILTRMGAAIEVEEQGSQGGERIGAITARHSRLRGTRVTAAEVPLAIDELPLLGLLGCFCEGETVVEGAEELRHKESDRIAAVVEGITVLGGEIEATPDGFRVQGTGHLPGGTIDSRGDHRIAMLGAVAGVGSRRGVDVVDFSSVEVSYPGFTPGPPVRER